MKAPGLAVDENERLQILDDIGIVYSPAEERFDRITRLAARIFDVPIALITLINSNTQWFKSSQGLTACETSREISFCGHAILGEDTLIIPDASKDPDFADNPAVTGEPWVRFYAGHPISLNSVKLGTLCIVDHRPRRYNPGDFDILKSLALWVENELKLSLYSASQKELLAKVGKLERRSLIEPVTGCWNQRGMDILLEKEVAYSRRYGPPVSLLLIDVKNSLKKRDGTPLPPNIVEQVLKEVAQRIRRCVRIHDIVAKTENSRFMVCLSDCNTETCNTLTQRILRTIAIEPLKLEEGTIRLSALIGCTSNEGTDIWSATRLQDTVLQALGQAAGAGKENNFIMVKPKI